MFAKNIRKEREVNEAIPLKRIPDRRPDPSRLAGAELVIVVNQVQMRFRTHEKVSPDVELHTATDVPEKVIRAHIVGASEKVAVINARIEARALRATARHRLDAQPLPQPRRIDCVDIVKNRPKRL